MTSTLCGPRKSPERLPRHLRRRHHQLLLLFGKGISGVNLFHRILQRKASDDDDDASAAKKPKLDVKSSSSSSKDTAPAQKPSAATPSQASSSASVPVAQAPRAKPAIRSAAPVVFGSILRGVNFVLSGFQNPLRDNVGLVLIKL